MAKVTDEELAAYFGLSARLLPHLDELLAVESHFILTKSLRLN